MDFKSVLRDGSKTPFKRKVMAREVAQCLSTLTTLAEDPGSVLGPHIAVHNHL